MIVTLSGITIFVKLKQFENAEGGTIALGVEDDKSITGIEWHTKEVNEIEYAPINLCNPSFKCSFQKIDVIDRNGKPNHVLLIHVPMSFQVHEDTSGDSYCIVGDKSPKMSFNERLTLAYAEASKCLKLHQYSVLLSMISIKI